PTEFRRFCWSHNVRIAGAQNTPGAGAKRLTGRISRCVGCSLLRQRMMLAASRLIHSPPRRARDQRFRGSPPARACREKGRCRMRVGTALALTPCVLLPGHPRRNEMCAITVTDLEYDRELDHAAMSAISGGGGAPWVYGWITPFVPSGGGGAG